MKRYPHSAIPASVFLACVLSLSEMATAQTLPALITPYVSESDMASIQQIFNTSPDINAQDASLRFVHDGLDIAPTGNLKPFRAACSGRVHWVLALDDVVNVIIACNATYALEYNFEPQSAGTGPTQLAHISVAKGQFVSQGDVIGRLYVANPLAHVHFAVLKNWVPICPLQHLEPAASQSLANLVQARFPGTSMCHGSDATPPPLLAPYVSESDMASVNEAFSVDGSASPWGFVHDGIDFFPKGNLKPFRAACSGTVSSVQLHQNGSTSNWQVSLLIACNPYVADRNEGGYFQPLAARYIFEPMSALQANGQTQRSHISVTNGQAVSQGDVIGHLYTVGSGAHVHFAILPFASLLTNGTNQIPGIPVCPEPHFSTQARVSVLNLLHAVWPAADMCYTTSRSDCVFNWAEKNYAQFFAPAGAISATYPPYYYRHYANTGNYLAVSSANNNIYMLGRATGDNLLDVGPIANFLGVSGCQ